MPSLRWTPCRSSLPALAAGLFMVTSALACATLPGHPVNGVLENRYWRLVEVRGKLALPTSGMSEAHLEFSADSSRLIGAAGCNRISGPYTRNGERLVFGQIMATRMACADAQLNQQETDFLAALPLTNRHEVVTDTLRLFRDKERIATLIAVPR